VIQLRSESSEKKQSPNVIVDLPNHNIMVKAKAKVQKQISNNWRPTKDNQGKNIKKHFGVWKWFLNRKETDKEKFYISNTCHKVTGPQAKIAEKHDQTTGFDYNTIRGLGTQCLDKSKLEYYGIPKGICQ